MIENTSGVKPCGHRLLILPEQIEKTTASGIITVTDSEEERHALSQVFGKVVELGETAFADQPSPWCNKGDRVSFAKFAGLIVTGKDGKKYRVINDLDIVSVVEESVK